MKKNRPTLAILVLLTTSSMSQAAEWRLVDNDCQVSGAGPQYSEYLPEMYPEEVAEALSESNLADEAAKADFPEDIQQALFNSGQRWTPGSVVRVAFYRGTPRVYRSIAEAAKGWMTYANIKLDFGDAGNSAYRTWTPRDRDYSAEIRIAFNTGDTGGYWSAIGTDSVGPHFPPGRNSMNFEGFTRVDLPRDWRGTVLHEFGHALGFSHEHAQSVCKEEFRWEPGPNGEPSVYEIFCKWQHWKPKKVRVNLATFVPKPLDIVSSHDPKSIMHYAMPVECFVKGNRSPCFIKAKNSTLSTGDQEGAKRAYPRLLDDPRTVVLSRLAVAKSARQNLPSSENPSAAVIDRKIGQLVQQSKPRVFFFAATPDQKPFIDGLSAASGAEFAPVRVVTTGPRAFKPDMIEVRYLRNPEDRAAAERMLAVLQNDFHVKNARVSYTVRSPKAERGGDIEVWFARSIVTE